MAIRTIEYSVTASGISPATVQQGGVQGEHNATELVFTLDDSRLSEIKEHALGNRVVYRFDGYDGSGNMSSTEPKDLTDKPCVYTLEEWITRYGGQIQVYLVITEVLNDETQLELYSFPAQIRLKNKPVGEPTDGSSYESLSTLAEVAKASSETAAKSAEIAVEAQEQTEFARRALEEDTEFVFLGGNAQGSAKIELVIDDELSEYSDNAISNKAVAKGINSVSAIAKGRNRAHVFSDTESMQSWLSDSANAGTYQVGDNLYIVDTEVPDWWISEVLEEADTETGYFYKIAQLETQKVDLSNIEAKLDGLEWVDLSGKADCSDVLTTVSELSVFYNKSAHMVEIFFNADTPDNGLPASKTLISLPSECTPKFGYLYGIPLVINNSVTELQITPDNGKPILKVSQAISYDKFPRVRVHVVYVCK